MRSCRCAPVAILVLAGVVAACDMSAGTVDAPAQHGGPAADAGSVADAGASDPAAPTISDRERGALLALSPSPLPPAPKDVSNAFADDPKAAAFGQRLFYDTSLSGKLLSSDNDGAPGTLGTAGQTGKASCASCHEPTAAFTDTRSPGGALSLGAEWTRRRSPSLLDVGQSGLLGWDGRHDALYNMSSGAMESPAAMNGSRLFVAEQVFQHHRAEYEAIFGAMPAMDDPKFPQLGASLSGCASATSLSPDSCDEPPRGGPGDPAYDKLSQADQDAVTRVFVNLGKSLAAYQRLLTCGPGRFDAWIHGQNDALDAAEQRGARLFVGKGACLGCHSGPYFSDNELHNVGVASEPRPDHGSLEDNGALTGMTQAIGDPLGARQRFSDGDNQLLPPTVTESLRGAFRTPRLRCASKRPSFMHTGALKTMDAVVDFFNRGGESSGFAGVKQIAPLGLDPTEMADLVAFLKALDGPGPAAPLLGPPP